MKILASLCALTLLAQSAFGEVILTVTKTPYEAFNCSMDFTQVIGTNGITLLSVTSTNKATGADTTATIIAASPAPAVVPGFDQITFRVQGGTNGQTHQVSVKVIDATNGAQYEGDMWLVISQTQ